MAYKCKLCGKECYANKDFLVRTSSYYRCCPGSIFQLCSDECKDTFKRTKQCWFCGYDGDLVHVPENGFMVCTSNEHWRYSCLDKYNLRKANNLKLDVNEYTDDDYDEMSKSNHERIMDLQRSLADANRRIDDLEWVLSKSRDRFDEFEQMFQQSINKNN